MASPFRTKEMTEKHEAYRKTEEPSNLCVLCTKESIKDFEYWRVVENSFPYDLVAKVHHMLILKRHANEYEINTDEEKELKKIKLDYLSTQYDYIIECMPKNKSVPEHLHLHILISNT